MQAYDKLPAHVPSDVANGIADYADQVRKICQDNLVCMTLYGSLIRGDYRQGFSNINLLIVLNDARMSHIQKIAKVSRAAFQTFRIEPQFISKGAFLSGGRIFPMTFLDIQESYVILYGDDLLAAFEIDTRFLKYQCIYHLRTTLMRSRRFYLFSAQDAEIWTRTLIRSFSGFLFAIKTLLKIMGERIPGDAQSMIRLACKRFQMDAQKLLALYQLKTNPRKMKFNDVSAMFEDYLDVVYGVIKVIEYLSI